jgi:microcystin-dependent protein
VSNPFLGEIKIVSFNFAPKGWALCNGQFLPINQNQALFSILGTTYGGNGQTTFALPDLRGRSPFHIGNGHTLGERGGEEAHTLTLAEMPTHSHFLNASSASVNQVGGPNGNTPAVSTQNPYESTFNGAMAPGALSNVGGSQAHLNLQPYLCLNFAIALIGIFPSQN